MLCAVSEMSAYPQLDELSKKSNRWPQALGFHPIGHMPCGHKKVKGGIFAEWFLLHSHEIPLCLLEKIPRGTQFRKSAVWHGAVVPNV